MKKIIVFYGTKGVGKDTCFEILQNICFFEQGKNIQKVSFADYLKKVVYTLFETKIGDSARIFGEIKDKEMPIEGWNIPAEIKEKCGFIEDLWTGRRLLQWFGTEVCRNVYHNVWVDSLIKTIREKESVTDTFVVTDCRFFNEYEILTSLSPEYSVLFVHVKRETGDNEFSGHASEKDIFSFKCDIELDNGGTIEQLKEKIKHMHKDYLII